MYTSAYAYKTRARARNAEKFFDRINNDDELTTLFARALRCDELADCFSAAGKDVWAAEKLGERDGIIFALCVITGFYSYQIEDFMHHAGSD